jgi:hypothetical protein
MHRCSWCPEDNPAPAEDLISVGFAEQGSGGGWIYYACPRCLKDHDLVPLAEHPRDTTGRPLTREQWHVIIEALTCCGLIALTTALTLRR